ncbi:DUF2391 family protein [Candidatus Woesearchaeota archaeon]|nr:DUF2391 family protein [Candidatus Woesearchaeota archaeon]
MEDAKIKKEVEEIENKIGVLYDKIYEKRPSHFGKRDIVNAVFASLTFGLIFLFKGSLIDISLNLKEIHLILIVAVTAVILTLEIYFVGFTRIGPTERGKRRFGQFWAKRFFTFYGVSLLIPLCLVYLYDINNIVAGGFDILKIVIAVSMPCTIGAAIPGLLKQY